MQTAIDPLGVVPPRSSGDKHDIARAVPGLETREPLPVNFNTGLTSEEAGRRLKQFGPNAVPDTTLNPFRMALEKFWAPVPWMLEAAIVLQMVLGEYVEAAIIAGLLVFNAALGFFQEGRAQATLAALKSRLALTATVRRNGVWTNLPAAELVPGDIVKLSLGAVVAADVRLARGIGSARSVHAHRRIHPHRSRPGLPNLCRGADPARRGGCGGDGDRNTHEVWSYCGACAQCPCRKFPAEGCAARGAQSGDVQRHPHRHPRGVCLRFTPCRLPKSFPSCSRRFWPQSR